MCRPDERGGEFLYLDHGESEFFFTGAVRILGRKDKQMHSFSPILRHE